MSSKRWISGPWGRELLHDCEKLTTTEEKQAYLAGAFLGGGTVSRPQSDYHLEMATRCRYLQKKYAKSCGCSCILK